MRGWGFRVVESRGRRIFLGCTLICSLLWKGCSRKNLLRILWGDIGVSIGMDAKKRTCPWIWGGVFRIWDLMRGRYEGVNGSARGDVLLLCRK